MKYARPAHAFPDPGRFALRAVLLAMLQKTQRVVALQHWECHPLHPDRRPAVMNEHLCEAA